MADAASIDKYIHAELLDIETSSLLYRLVEKCMIHGPSGRINSNASCMIGKRCGKKYPRPFIAQTMIDEEGFPTYRRRDDIHTVVVGSIALDNRSVVPYNPTLLMMFQTHINVEKCNQSSAIYYLFKYITKGNDRVIAAIYGPSSSQRGQSVDEIKQYYNCRYVSSFDGC